MKIHQSILILGFAFALSFSCKPADPTITTAVTEVESKVETEDQNISSSGPQSITRNVIQDQVGNIWLAAWDGVFRYDGDSFTPITHDVSSSRFFSLLEDSQGHIWMGTIGSGVFRYDGEHFQNFNQSHGLIGNEIVSIYEDRSGAIWLGANGGLSRYDGENFQNFTLTPDSLFADAGIKPRINISEEVPQTRNVMEANAIMEDKSGILWFATRGYTYRYDGDSFTPIVQDGQHFINTRHLIQDQRGDIWLGGQSGLWRYDGSTFLQLSDNFTGYIYEDIAGNIWTSSEIKDGDWALSRYDQNLLSAVRPSSQVIKSKEGMLFGILAAENGEIWYGTLQGFRRFDPSGTLGF